MAETHVRDLLGEMFRRGGMRKAMRRAEAVVLWPRIVGPKLARFTRARSLKGGVLFVDVPDSETAMHLSMQRHHIVQAYGRRFGSREVREIRFRAGRPIEADAEAPPATGATPDPEELVSLTRELGALDLPERLAGPALSAARAMLAHRSRARAGGWTPCPHCGALSPDPGPCDACRRHREAPRVRRAADRLVRRPDAPLPELGEDEAAVARALAVETLEAHVAELLPQVLASPTGAPQLELAARHLLALLEGVAPDDLDDDHHARLDPRVARALGRPR